MLKDRSAPINTKKETATFFRKLPFPFGADNGNRTRNLSLGS